ncbi:conserved hypothetical protein [Rhodopseudomonas palustris HaA2]|uniref:Uncharacterized protein n=1 Tax=Rhodopseudomonas palustris (strain HaA2) TaxID=316058 RepID=Q2IYZ1_RHOP2|nr:hypothetical protein [Rhodopseudomonas palustris]ABD06569.1 conserved hypothetical protein [Rhodopseudomonas palustris HaA2]
MTGIDARQAAQALSEIDGVVRRVRQSRIYDIASLMLMQWGALVVAGYLGSYVWPRAAGWLWVAVNVVGIAGSFSIGAFVRRRTGAGGFDLRVLLALLLFFAFGYFTCVLGHFGPRELGAFWALYFMLVYTIAGLWVGRAFVAIGLGIAALTLLGYFFVGVWFEPWMAVVNGGGLILGGLWMRRD